MDSKQTPLKSGDVSVTKNMLDSAISEVKSELSSVRYELKSDIASVKSDVAAVKSDVDKVLAAVHRTNLLVEDQNARNRVVLEGYEDLKAGQRDSNERLGQLEKQVFGIESK